MIVYKQLKEVLIEDLNNHKYFEIFYPLMQVNKLIKKTRGSFSNKRYKTYKTALNEFLDISIDLNLLKEIIPETYRQVKTHLGTYDFLDMDITSMGRYVNKYNNIKNILKAIISYMPIDIIGLMNDNYKNKKEQYELCKNNVI